MFVMVVQKVAYIGGGGGGGSFGDCQGDCDWWLELYYLPWIT